MAQSSSPFHYIVLVLAAMNALQFLIFNSRGILSWSGVGVYVTVLYAVVFVLSAIEEQAVGGLLGRDVLPDGVHRSVARNVFCVAQRSARHKEFLF
jgi:hypothetical protein